MPKSRKRRRSSSPGSSISLHQRLLKPTKITATFRDTPVGEAAAILTRKSGRPITVMTDWSLLENRKVTLELHDVPFWQALDQFCRAAGLKEGSAVSDPATAKDNGWRGRGRRGPRFDAEDVVPPMVKPVSLVDGKQRDWPTEIVGAARVRVPLQHRAYDGQPQAAEVTLPLELALEGRPLLRITSVRFKRIVDEWGKDIQAKHEPRVVEYTPDPRGRPVIVDEFHLGSLAANGDGRADTITLTMGKKPTRSLKEFSGSILAEVLVADTIVSVEDVSKTIGQTIKGVKGASVTVHEIMREDDGTIALRLSAESTQEAVRMPGVLHLGGVYQGVKLYDSAGREFLRPERRTQSVPDKPKEVIMRFQPPDKDAKPARLVNTISRVAIMEVPFSMKNVPLP